MFEMSEWKNYKKGEVSCYSWKLDRVQAKITDSHYINNFVDHIIFNNVPLLHDFDKIILFGTGNPIALFPKNTDDLNGIITYLESIKNTDIHTVVVSLGDSSGVFVNCDLIDDVLGELNAHTKIEVRYALSE